MKSLQGASPCCHTRSPRQARHMDGTHTHWVMFKTLHDGIDTWSGKEDADDYCSVDSFYPDYPTDAIHLAHAETCHNRQLVRGASHHGCHVGMTGKDVVAVEFVYLAEPLKQTNEGWFGDNLIAPSSVSNLFKLFTCKIAGWLDWNLERQQAKQQEKVKKVRAAGRACPQASLAYQDIDLKIGFGQCL